MNLDGMIFRLARLLGRKHAEPLARSLAAASRSLAAFAHRQQANVQSLPPLTQHSDHFVYAADALATGVIPTERGVFGSLPHAPGSTLLELCCGAGFHTPSYAVRAACVLAVDRDPAAIGLAKKRYRPANIKSSIKANIEFRVADLCDKDFWGSLPPASFDGVIWDASIAYFTPEATEGILAQIKTRLMPSGVLSGCTSLLTSTHADNPHCPWFDSKEEVAAIFSPFWKNVKAFAVGPIIYFWASDGALPFDAEWPQSANRSSLLSPSSPLELAGGR